MNRTATAAIGAAALFTQAHTDQVITRLKDEIAKRDQIIQQQAHRLAAYEDQGMRSDVQPVQRKARSRRGAKSNRGRRAGQPIVQQNGAEYWSVAYTSQRTGLSQATISRRARDGEIVYVPIGGLSYIAAASARNLKTKNAHR